MQNKTDDQKRSLIFWVAKREVQFFYGQKGISPFLFGSKPRENNGCRLWIDTDEDSLMCCPTWALDIRWQDVGRSCSMEHRRRAACHPQIFATRATPLGKRNSCRGARHSHSSAGLLIETCSWPRCRSVHARHTVNNCSILALAYTSTVSCQFFYVEHIFGELVSSRTSCL
jgi:hypothetical protein